MGKDAICWTLPLCQAQYLVFCKLPHLIFARTLFLPCSIDEGTEAQRLSEVYKVTRLQSSGTTIWPWFIWHHSLCQTMLLNTRDRPTDICIIFSISKYLWSFSGKNVQVNHVYLSIIYYWELFRTFVFLYVLDFLFSPLSWGRYLLKFSSKNQMILCISFAYSFPSVT